MTAEVNSLFQTCGIEDIQIVEKKIRGEIEKKKEDLRVMVGERYRDLINAADTIQDMHNGTEQILSGIASVVEICSGFDLVNQDKNEIEKSSRLTNQAFYALATQMNLLVDTPEQIWSALDTHQYLQAVLLYMLSQHIVTNSLNIQSGSSKRDGKHVFHSFPILHHQWAAISHFKASILKGAKCALKDTTLPDRGLAECLCCLSLLDNLSPRQVFTEFVMARKIAIQDVFHPSMHSASVKKQICDVTHIIRLSIQQMSVLFYNTEDQEDQDVKPLFYEVLHEVTTEKPEQSPRAFQSLFDNDVDVLTVARYLPPSVTGFIPKLKSAPVSISISFIQKHAVEWLNECTKDIHEGVKELLTYVDSIKALASIRDAVYDLLITKANEVNITEDKQGSPSWEKCCQICLGRFLSVWDELFQPLFFTRAEIIIQKQMNGCFANLKSSLLEVLKSLTETGNTIHDSVWDQNISSFMWHDFPQDFSDILQCSEQNEENMLFLKVKYYTPAIKRLCAQLNTQLDGILLDVQHFICDEDIEDGLDEQERRLEAIKKDVRKLIFDSEDGFGSNIPEPFQKYGNAGYIKSLISSLFIEQVEQLCNVINSKMTEYESEIQNSGAQESLYETANINSITFLCRFCLAVPDLCNNIQKTVHFESGCLKKPSLKRQSSRQTMRKTVANKHENIITVESLLDKQSKHGFEIWAQWICEKCKESVKTMLTSANDYILFATTNWEVVEIDEENEQGERVKSTIRVPSQLSFYLSSLYYSITEEFHRVGDAVIDRTSITSLGVQLGISVVQAHDDHVKALNGKQKLYQNKALQMMFDLKFTLKLFGGVADSKLEISSTLKQQANALISRLESFVDPFDLDVFTPHLNTSVQRQVQRSWLMFGSISNTDKYNVPTRLSSSSHEEHSVVQVVPNPPRFMLLPVSTHRKDEEQTHSISLNYGDEFTSPLLFNQLNLTIDFINSTVY